MTLFLEIKVDFLKSNYLYYSIFSGLKFLILIFLTPPDFVYKFGLIFGFLLF